MIKKLLILSWCMISTIITSAQDKETKGRTLPSVDLKTMTGENINSLTFSNDGKPLVIDFWATWCKPCIEELNEIHDLYADWIKETCVKIIIISIDDARTATRVAPLVNGKGWDYESYLDMNGDFKRAMNVNMPPQTFVLNGNGEFTWQHVGYEPGNENELYEAIKKAAAMKRASETK